MPRGRRRRPTHGLTALGARHGRGLGLRFAGQTLGQEHPLHFPPRGLHPLLDLIERLPGVRPGTTDNPVVHLGSFFEECLTPVDCRVHCHLL
jgi:hypothetical protein